MTSGEKIQLAKRIDELIEGWLRATGRDEARPKDVMPLLIQNHVFPGDHKQGLPLRKLLRELQRSGDRLSCTRCARNARTRTYSGTSLCGSPRVQWSRVHGWSHRQRGERDAS